ncbi:MAG: hypothetical protein N3H84_08375, partial [Candidatus Caldarchaeum sp.]|nr:hypothetical protein [Candidatus Caldarchaeum sp.]
MTHVLHWTEKAVLTALNKLGGRASYEDIAETVAEILKKAGTQWHSDRSARISSVAKACGWLLEKGLVEVEEDLRKQFVVLDSEGFEYVVHGLPERRVVDYLNQRGGESSVEEIRNLEKSDIGLMWARYRGWIEFVKKDSTTFVRLKGEVPETTEVERFLQSLHSMQSIEVPESGPVRQLVNELVKRQKVVRIVEKTMKVAALTSSGRALAQQLTSIVPEVTSLTPDLIRSGRWREVVLSGYDVRAPTPPVFAAKRHPLNEVIRMVKQAYVEMGFEEIEGPIVELAFWNFDALFQPQDHPAREMQDTFYLLHPSIGDLPSQHVEAVSAVHENGGDTGSKGWRYKWSAEEARKLLLRTHTT